MAESFGEEVTYLCLTAKGEMTIETAKQFAVEVVEAVGMRCSHPPHVSDYLPEDYPSEDGQYIGFVLHQPLIESFCDIDYWANHKGFYLFISSCKDFDSVVIESLLAKWGFERRTIAGGYLSL